MSLTNEERNNILDILMSKPFVRDGRLSVALSRIGLSSDGLDFTKNPEVVVNEVLNFLQNSGTSNGKNFLIIFLQIIVTTKYITDQGELDALSQIIYKYDQNQIQQPTNLSVRGGETRSTTATKTVIEVASSSSSPLSQTTKNSAILFTELRDNTRDLLKRVQDWELIYNAGLPAIQTLLYRTINDNFHDCKTLWSNGMEYLQNHDRNIFNLVSNQTTKLIRLIDYLLSCFNPIAPKLESIRETVNAISKEVDTIYEIAASSINQ